MAVDVFTPGLRVDLIKTIGRKDGVAQRYSESRRDIDLTPLLGPGGSVRTAKHLMSPAGSFSISFGDQPDKLSGDSLYAMIEPMDMIEIRASRTPWQYAGGKLPLIMRGFVTRVTRQEAMGDDGTPQRSVVVTGSDAGKLWTMNQIIFQISILTDNAYLNSFHLQVATGISAALLPVSEFMRQITDKVLNAKLQKLAASGGRTLPPFTVDASVVQGTVMPQRAANFDSVSVWTVAEAFVDRPWNELFIEDQEDGPHLVFRPAPFRDLTTGNLISPEAADPGSIIIDDSQVVSVSMSRSDERVANFFWVPPGDSMLDADLAVNTMSLMKGEPIDWKYPNDAPELYGVRMMTVVTSLLPTDLANVPAQLPKDQQEPATGSILLWHQARARLLKLMNRDNAAFEEGELTVQGHESLKIGRYLLLQRGSLLSRSYIQSVAHNLAPMGIWTTDLSVIRGDGFQARTKLNTPPYWAEGRKGPYSA